MIEWLLEVILFTMLYAMLVVLSGLYCRDLYKFYQLKKELEGKVYIESDSLICDIPIKFEMLESKKE